MNYKNYQSITNESDIIHATPFINDMTIINAETPKPTRRKFILNVYSILWAQLLFTSLYVGVCYKYKPLNEFLKTPQSQSLLLLVFFIQLILLCIGSCNVDLMRKCPFGGIFLSLFTICMSYIVGFVSIAYSINSIIMSGLSTIGIFTGLSLYAIQTKYDFTDKGGYFICLFFGLIMFGFFASFINSPINSIIYSSIGSIIFSMYIVYDTQLIVGGDHKKITFHTDDYILAAMSLYLDIINLFIMLLDLISGR